MYAFLGVCDEFFFLKRKETKRSWLIMEKYGYEVRTFLLSVTRRAGGFRNRLSGESKEKAVYAILHDELEPNIMNGWVLEGPLGSY